MTRGSLELQRRNALSCSRSREGGRRITIKLAATRVALCIAILGSTGMPVPRLIVAQTSGSPEPAQEPLAQGPEHPPVAESLHNLATVLREGAEYAEAQTLYERALTVR